MARRAALGNLVIWDIVRHAVDRVTKKGPVWMGPLCHTQQMLNYSERCWTGSDQSDADCSRSLAGCASHHSDFWITRSPLQMPVSYSFSLINT